MENTSFNDMPVAPTPPKLPKYFPDLQGENRGLTPHIMLDGTKMSLCPGFKVKIQRKWFAMELECSYLQVNCLES